MTREPTPRSRGRNHRAVQKPDPPEPSSAERQDRSPNAGETLQSASAQEGSSDSTQTKIFPRNLTARAQFQVVGNPIVTRAEDAVANCFPGLELDIRNLDRRFFPGLVFNFVEPAGDSKRGTQYGAKLAYIDVLEDPDLRLDLEETQYRFYEVMEITPKYAKELYAELAATGKNPVTGKYTAATSLATGNWYLDWIEQGGKKISTRSGKDDLTGLTVWRLIRGLEPGLVSIGLKRRDKPYAKSALVLHGWRRLYTDPRTGVISGAYQPGELMQGLCSPWQHDFRDCYCHYWASNRSDLVFGDLYPGEPVLPDGEAVDSLLNLRLDWMRADRSRELAVEAFGIVEKNRPYQFDHFQINREWQNLSIVLNGREIDSVHLSEPDDAANPYDTPEKLAEQLRDFLAPLELTFVFEYLFARFSLRNPPEVRNEPVRDALTLAREYLLLIAISEMQRLRWANEILWELRKAGKIKDYKPVIKLADLVPQESGGPLPDGSRTDKKVVEEYIKARRKIRFRPTDEVATARAVLEFKNDYPDRPDDYPDDPPQEVIDKFKATFDKFKRMRQNAAPNEWPPPRGPQAIQREVSGR
jgi:hypothetical protein